MTKHIEAKRGKRLPAPGHTENSSSHDVVKVEPEKTAAIITEKEAKAIRDRLIELKVSVESTYLEMGKLISDVKEKCVEDGKPLWKHWGFDTFDRYCEEELGFRERKGYYLLSVYRNTIDGPLSGEAIEKIGHAKAAILAPLAEKGVISAEGAEKWIEKAQNSTFDELRITAQKALAESKKKAEAGKKQQVAPEEVQIFKVPLFKPQWENLQIALKKAEAITGSDKTPWLVDCIAMAFNSEAFSTKAEALDEICRRVERAFSVRLIALKADEDQVVFGDRIAKMLEASVAATRKKQEK